MVVPKKLFTKSLCIKLCIVLVALAVVSAISYVSYVEITRTDRERVENYVDLGDKYLGKLKYEQAVVAYSKALEIDPKEVEAVCGLANAYLGLEDTDSAKEIIQDYIAAVEDDRYKSEQEDAYALLAEIYYEEGEYDSAVDVIRQAVVRIDTDKDTVPDYYENLIGLSYDKVDSNEDGIIDKSVVYDLLLPEDLLADSDIMYMDSDEDGLSNSEELINKTNPFLNDTDGDLLSDRDEWYLHYTNPLQQDTDGDGLWDGTEIAAGFNPNKKDTDEDGREDGKVSFERLVYMPSIGNHEKNFIPVALVKGEGEYYGVFDAEALNQNETLSGIGSRLSHPYDFKVGKKGEKNSKIGFYIPAKMVNSYYDLEDLLIAYYDYTKNQIDFKKTEASYQEDGSILVLTDDVVSGTYLLLSYKRLKNDLSANENSVLVTSGKADVVFVLDTTGSMDGPIDNVRQNIAEFTEYLKESGVDIRIGLVIYKDIYDDGIASTENLGFYYDYDEFLDVLNSPYMIGGGGDISETTVDALNEMRQMDFRAGVSKFAIVITDADNKNGIKEDETYTLEQIADDLVEDGICTSVITYSMYSEEYDSLIEKTAGEFGNIEDSDFINMMTPLMDKMGTMVQEGCWVRLANGCIVHLQDDPALGGNIDSDGDGISDREELGEIITVSYTDYSGAKISYKAYGFQSNPALADSDGDGYLDSEDIHPLQSDTEEARLSKKDEYLKILDEDIFLKGVKHSGTAEERISTSIAALENMLLYLQRTSEFNGMTSVYLTEDYYESNEICELTEELISSYEVEEEKNFAEALSKTRDLKKLFGKILKKRNNIEDKYVSARLMCSILNDYVSRYDSLCYYIPLELFEKEELITRICSSLEKKYPVLLQCGAAGALNLYSDENLQGKQEQAGASEWLTVAGYKNDSLKGTFVLKVIYDGKLYYVNYEEVLYQGFLGALVGVR